MRRGFALVAVLFLVGVGSALGYVAESPNAILATGPGELANDLPRPSLNGARLDTVYFGGDDGAGNAFLNGIWDWDTIVSDPLQGWTSKDMTEDPGTYFARVNAASFAGHGDPCTPLFANGGAWQLWCGVHEDEANLRDFVSGMGYGNNSCQQAKSPIYAISTGQTVATDYIYFNDSEVGFDYTYTYINCFDSVGDLIDQFEIGKFDARDGTYDAPSTFTNSTAFAELDPDTRTVQLELRFKADGGWSDEDGLWATDCGPFAADNIGFDIAASTHDFNFESGAQGWTFLRCPGKGAFMAVWPEATWRAWIEQVGLLCSCPMAGNALGFCEEQLSGLPAFPVLHHEQGFSGPVIRGIYQPPDYNAVYVRMAGYANLPHKAGTFARGGYSLYPYITEYNPVPHWSPRDGQDVWYYTGDTPYCTYNNGIFNWDLTHPPDGNPIPPTWDRMRFIFETNTDCVSFLVPTGVCTEEGVTLGSPLIDRCQIGLTFAPDAPSLTPETGMLFADGFGQKFPTYLEPGDVGNANASYDVSRDYPERNDWHGDTVTVSGPVVGPASPRRWLARFCVKVERKGARQDQIPGYLAWKARLAYAGNPEVDYVCVEMDSVQIPQGPYKNKFLTYFHENEVGFDHSHPDYTRWQEIMPDSIWTPGTKLNYKFQSKWIDGAEYGDIGPWEFEILPNMQLQAGEDYAVEWPCVLYIDRFNRGSEYYIVPLLEQMGLDYDKFDGLDAGSNYDTSIKRTFGGTYYNVGGWGNNGMTSDQVLGYRLILFSLGTLGLGACELGDWDILELWLTDSRCGLGDVRRGLIMNGDEIARAMNDNNTGSPGFLNNVLGTTYTGVYRLLNGNDPDYCVMLEPASGAVFQPAAPGVGLYGNGCPNQYSYAVLDRQSGIQNTVGNLRYWSYQGGGPNPYINYAQVVRTNIVSQTANWKSVVDGFSFHHVSERGCAGEDCSPDSACIVRGASDLMGPELIWMAAGGSPFVKWRYPCEDVAVGDDSDTHLSGPVNYLYAARPNPFRGTATIRFALATPTNVNVSIYDVSGRLVRTLVDGAMDKGEFNQTWDGADNGGHRVSGGIFWMKMRTDNGYQSSMRIVVVPR